MWEEIVHRIEGPGRVVAEFGDGVVGTDHPGTDREGRDPEPWRLFLASIGTCAASFVAAEAAERGIDPTGLTVVQRTAFRGDDSDALDVSIEVVDDGSLSAEDRAALVAAAERCTVKRAIEAGTKIRIAGGEA